ncbi:MAG: hypothetical protein J6Q89_06445 [Clostridia bacterium]|jgi:hypothetical protein|nr:hypothetical protein [Clostridia bacterium]
MEKVLIIHISKETGAYCRYEKYELNEKLTMDFVQKTVDEWNNNEDVRTKALVYMDELFIHALEDCEITKNQRYIIDNLRGVVRDIESAVMDLDSWVDDITEKLKRLENEKE